MPVKIRDLKTLLVHELKDLYSAETQLLEALPRMAKTARAMELKEAFTSHLQETREHVKRLESVFETLEFQPGGAHCNGMEGLIEEGEDMIEEDAPGEVKDAGLIASAQRVEHYEIAGYGVARAFAHRLGMKEIAAVLQKTLDEEGAADRKLTEIAERSVNQNAA